MNPLDFAVMLIKTTFWGAILVMVLGSDLPPVQGMVITFFLGMVIGEATKPMELAINRWLRKKLNARPLTD